MDEILASMRAWMGTVRERISAPEVLELFDTYAGEAIFGRQFIADDLKQLNPHARLLEVGAGCMLLSAQLRREGFDITALEPTGSGFSHFETLREAVLGVARQEGCMPRVLPKRAEDLDEIDRFDYAFSVNVMEHVDDVATTLRNVVVSLSDAGVYHFTCPNYLFPYEVHFNMPTLLSKRLTEWVFRDRIYGYDRLGDPAGTWRSLNWITVPQIARIARRLPSVRITFNRALLVATFERVLVDTEFARRRSALMVRLISAAVAFRLHKLLILMPASLQPIIDCRLQKQGVQKTG